MSRPKKNTAAGRIATERWRKTMVEKYGEEGVKERFRQIGSLGGRAKGIPKGFALNPERARWAGAKGGKISSRAGISTGEGKKREYVKIDDSIINVRSKTGKTLHTHKVVEPEPKGVSSTRWPKWFRREEEE